MNVGDRARKRLDERLTVARRAEQLTPPAKGWIRALRDGLGMSGNQLGTRLGLTQQAVDKLEKSEIDGTIQLQTLRRVAEGLNATLVYALVPKTSLEEMVERRAREIALRALGRVSQTMRLEDQQTSDRDLEARIADFIRDELRDRDLWNEP